jgi:hypothetical protein
VKRFLRCGFRRTAKAMEQFMNECWWRICREIFFSQVRISYVLRFISVYDLFTDSPSYMRHTAREQFVKIETYIWSAAVIAMFEEKLRTKFKVCFRIEGSLMKRINFYFVQISRKGPTCRKNRAGCCSL